jgi:hypothetical protein
LADVLFDENFLSVLAYNKLPFHNALPVLAPETILINNSTPVAHTGPPFVIADDCDSSVPWEGTVHLYFVALVWRFCRMKQTF